MGAGGAADGPERGDVPAEFADEDVWDRFEASSSVHCDPEPPSTSEPPCAWADHASACSEGVVLPAFLPTAEDFSWAGGTVVSAGDADV
mmetsp:Transcript_37827/g.73885  ORF Transcript_37827/g.73885 Transcript_37827/m.73885 type:complete len:89 (+) Transcript_37827:723-989(+)